MTQHQTWTRLGLATALTALAVSATSARAAYIATFAQVGPDVVVTGAGSVNLAGLTRIAPNNDVDTGFMYAKAPYLGVGPLSNTPVDKYSVTVNSSSPFGTSGTKNPTAGSGNMYYFALVASPTAHIDVPTGYVSGDPLSGTLTFANQTFATLGLTTGTFTSTWGSGATADSFTAVIPEPASLAALSLAATALLRRRRYRSSRPCTAA